MSERPKPKTAGNREAFSEKIGSRAERKLKAKRGKPSSAWSGLGMMGLIGWSVAIPTIAGTALGIWLDKNTRGTISWTLTLLIAGIAAGSLNAWRLLSRESKGGDEEQDDGDE